MQVVCAALQYHIRFVGDSACCAGLHTLYLFCVGY